MYSTAMSRLTSMGTVTLSLMLFVADRMLLRAFACAQESRDMYPSMRRTCHSREK